MERIDNQIKIGITHGDINGINYEILIKALSDNRMLDFCIPIVYGSFKVFNYYRKMLNISDFSLNVIKKIEQANPKRPNMINIIEEEVLIEVGKSTKMAGTLSLLALEQAVADIKQELIHAIVTLPINKANIQSDKFKFYGHTEFFAANYDTSDYLMMMVSDIMKIAFVTGHVPLSKVTESITVDNILHKLRILSKSLLTDFAIRKPKIAVLSLNPHASDDGLIGSEENDIILPAIRKAFDEGIVAVGPFSSDGFFASGQFKKFDAILAMYHDQGMTVFKSLNFETGVNYTAGLPIIRTSPAHGTAYEIAGKNVASPDSFRNAIYLACDIYKNRMMWNEINKNPLKINKIDLEQN